jgi:GWxTD domain-containing protein
MSSIRLGFAGLLALCLVAQAATKTKVVLPKHYKQWIEQDVVYIITDEEKKAFLQLTTDAERDGFIENFWEIRNPVRGAKQNLFKEEHYQRIQYANEYFGRQSNTPGWMTDMGRCYIQFGKPVSKVNFTGYGQIYPLELWFYENKAGDTSLPPFFYVLFFIPEDIGEYRFYHPIIDGPMQLVRGSQFNSNGDVYNFLAPLGGDIAHAVFSLIPNDPIDKQNYTVNMSGEMLISKIQNLANDPFNVKRIRQLRAERAMVTSYMLLNQEDALDVSTMVLTDAEGQTWLDYSIWINREKLGKADANGHDFKIDTGFQLSNEAGDLIVDDSEERSYAAFEETDGKMNFVPFRAASRIPIVPGKYNLKVQVTQRQAGKIYEAQRKITVPAPNAVALNGPLLASAVRKADKPGEGNPFEYYGVQFVPLAERSLNPREPLRLLFQVQVPEGDARNYTMEYLVAHTQIREQRQDLKETIQAKDFQKGRFLKAKTITLTGMAEGDYRIVVNLRAEGSAEVAASVNVPFHVFDEAGNERLYFLSNFRASAKGGVAAYIRALESMAQKDREKASEYMTQAVDQNPANQYADQLLVGLYFNSHKYDRVTALYEKMGLNAFRSAPETLAQISVSFWEAGKAAEARQVMQTARSLFPQDPLLSATEKSLQRMAR